MFTRYKSDEKGRRVAVAKVYTSKEHNIHNSQIDKDCLWAIRKMWSHGYKAYVVGGAVRDMILGKRPKDFDIATSASPKQIQRLFWNSRIIGKRFRIVHLFFASKIIEVTTFRSDEENFEEGNNNIFGTIEQDARRRDFSINALYYNPLDGHLLDFNNGLDDIRKKVIRSLIPLSYSFKEDPVRMIRAVKYSCTTGFRLKWDVKRALKRDSSCLEHVSISRLTDEALKIFNSGCSYQIILALHKYNLLPFILPGFELYIKYSNVLSALQELDEKVMSAKSGGSSFTLADILQIIARPVLVYDESRMSVSELSHELFRQIKVFVAPLTPPNYEIEKAVDLILAQDGLKTASIQKRKNTPQRKKGAAASARSQRYKYKNTRKKKDNARSSSVQPADISQASSSAEAHDL